MFVVGGLAGAAVVAGVIGGPLLGCIVGLGLLLLFLAFRMGVRPRDWVPRGLRESLSGLWEPSPLYAQADDLRRAASRSPSTTPAGAKRSRGAGAAKRPPRPAKVKARPLSKRRPLKPVKPAGAVKPRRISKPSRSGKPTEMAKPPGALKPDKPARATPAKAQSRRRAASRSRHADLRPVDKQPQRRTLTCSIFGWRDGEVADFYAVAFGLQGRDWIVERSPRFHWPAGDVPAEAYAAHATLVDALIRAGWRPTGSEGAWYRQRLERAVGPSSERR